MFVQSRVVAALEQHAEQFLGYEQQTRDQMVELRRLLELVAGWSREQLMAALAEQPFPGALPTAEQGRGGRPIIPFPMRWDNHEQARAWALRTLQGRPTFAVDGSQIPPQHSVSVPVAMVQVGWFENPHEAGVRYEKDIEVEVLPPDQVTYVSGDDFTADSEMMVNVRRYQRESARICTYLREHADDSRRPIVFFDGSLVASFAARLPEEVRAAYLSATLEMLAASRDAQVPLIGYVDTSYAHDLVEMITTATAARTRRIGDAGLLAGYMSWGDRSPAYICARADRILSEYRDAAGWDWSRQVAFVYLKTTAHLPPARVEFPLWMVEAGRLGDALDIVRAEVVVGNGYPYPLETADAVAVLTLEDRERFNQTLQEFARQHELGLHYSRKALSKRQRRV